jgi:hypothetical protein
MPDYNFSHLKKLIEYVYPDVAELGEISQIMSSEQVTVDDLWTLIEQVMNAQFIMKADETGISIYEKFLNIVPKQGETLDERRAEVLSAFQDSLPYTRKMLKNLLLALGIPDDSLQITYPDNFHVEVGVSREYESLMDFIRALLERMSPYTMQNSVDYKKYTWGDALTQNWNYMLDKTWEEFLYYPY